MKLDGDWFYTVVSATHINQIELTNVRLGFIRFQKQSPSKEASHGTDSQLCKGYSPPGASVLSEFSGETGQKFAFWRFALPLPAAISLAMYSMAHEK